MTAARSDDYLTINLTRDYDLLESSRCIGCGLTVKAAGEPLCPTCFQKIGPKGEKHIRKLRPGEGLSTLLQMVVKRELR